MKIDSQAEEVFNQRTAKVHMISRLVPKCDEFLIKG